MSQRIILLHWDPFIPGSNWCWTISSYAEIETADIVNPPINKKKTPAAVPIDFFPFAVFTFRYSYNIVYKVLLTCIKTVGRTNSRSNGKAANSTSKDHESTLKD